MGGRRFNNRVQEIIRFLSLLIQAVIYLFLLIVTVRILLYILRLIW